MTKANTKTATATKANNVLAYYEPMLKGWQAAKAGPKPTAVELTASHALGNRPGTIVAMAIAMYLRKGGATSNEVQAGTGAATAQLNKLNNLIERKHATAVPLPPREGSKHKVYAIALPKAAAKAKAKAKPRTKANKAKAAATA